MQILNKYLKKKTREKRSIISIGNNDLVCDFESLKSFSCGIQPLDEFIHSELEIYSKNHYCSAYSVSTKNRSDDVVAVFALAFDSIVLETDDFEEMNSGISDTWRPKIEENHRIKFENKSVYPALEIAYLAVREDYQHKNLGKAIVDEIAAYAKRQTLAGCVFLTVKAYHTSKHSALGFYQKCHFAKLTPRQQGEVWPMFRTLWCDE